VRATRSRTRSARAQGLRTLQHQTLPVAVCYAIDTEAWLRALVLGHGGAQERRWATKDQVYDEALAWFLEHSAAQALRRVPERGSEPTEDLTFWLDSRLMQRARRLAQREEVKLARLIELALRSYVQQHVPEALLEFRRRVQEEAARLHAARLR